MRGSGPLFELAILKEYLPRFKPEIVLWFYFEGNDLNNLQDEKHSPLLMRYLVGGFTQGLIFRQHDLDQAILEYMQQKFTEPTEAEKEMAVGSKLNAVGVKLEQAMQRPFRYWRRISDLDGPTLELFGQIMAQAKNDVSDWGGTLYFVYLPTWERYARGNPGEDGQRRTKILSIVSNLGIPIIDVHPVFQSQSDPLSIFPFREPGHYNEKGHRLVAEEVLKTIFPVSQTAGLQTTSQSIR